MKTHLQKFLSKHFAKYFAIGGVATVLTTFLLWVAVDKLGFLAFYSNLVIAVVIFAVKFKTYTKTGVFDHGKSRTNFIKYVFIWAALVALSSLALWLFVDILKFSVVFVNPLVVIVAFLLRFVLFSVFNMLKQIE